MTVKELVNDRNGTLITPGCSIRVHEITGNRKAIVVNVYPDDRTEFYDGCWIAIRFPGRATQMMPSYMCEVIR